MLLGAELRSEMTLCRNTPTRIMTSRMGIKTQSRIALSRNNVCSSAMVPVCVLEGSDRVNDDVESVEKGKPLRWLQRVGFCATCAPILLLLINVI